MSDPTNGGRKVVLQGMDVLFATHETANIIDSYDKLFLTLPSHRSPYSVVRRQIYKEKHSLYHYHLIPKCPSYDPSRPTKQLQTDA
jgi:hypothetical protein